jgi:hypothetical protein
MPCVRSNKSNTKRPARSGSRAPVPCHAVCPSLGVSGRSRHSGQLAAYSTGTRWSLFGSYRAPAIRKAPETGPFCLPARDRLMRLLPNFCPMTLRPDALRMDTFDLKENGLISLVTPLSGLWLISS